MDALGCWQQNGNRTRWVPVYIYIWFVGIAGTVREEYTACKPCEKIKTAITVTTVTQQGEANTDRYRIVSYRKLYLVGKNHVPLPPEPRLQTAWEWRSRAPERS